MQIEHLRFLIEVAETGSISRAANRLHISQQGLSQAIQKLEKEFNIPLLNRTGNKIYQTDIGMKMVEKAKELLVRFDELNDIANSYRMNVPSRNTREIALLTTPFLAGTVLPNAIGKFSHKYPDIDLLIKEKLPEEIFEELKHNQDAIGLFSILSDELNLQEFNDFHISFNPFYECKQLACVSKTSPLANRRSITPSELTDYPLAIYDKGRYAQSIHALLKPYGKINVILQTSNPKLYRETIANGLAVGFSTDFSEFFERRDFLVTIPIENAPKFILGWVYSKDTSRNSSQKIFIQEIKQFLSQITID